jgi:hypothetical protein
MVVGRAAAWRQVKEVRAVPATVRRAVHVAHGPWYEKDKEEHRRSAREEEDEQEGLCTRSGSGPELISGEGEGEGKGKGKGCSVSGSD